MWQYNKSKKIFINFCILAFALTMISSNYASAKIFTFKKEKNEINNDISKKQKKKFQFWKKKDKVKIETPITSDEDNKDSIKPLMWETTSDINEFAQDEKSLQNTVFIKEIIVKGNNLIDVNDITFPHGSVLLILVLFCLCISEFHCMMKLPKIKDSDRILKRNQNKKIIIYK